MATPLEEALTLLQNARPDEVRITPLPDGKIQIEILPRQTATGVRPSPESYPPAAVAALPADASQAALDQALQEHHQSLLRITVQERRLWLDALPANQGEEDSEAWVQFITAARMDTNRAIFSE
jgi:hypothetical protein